MKGKMFGVACGIAAIGIAAYVLYKKTQLEYGAVDDCGKSFDSKSETEVPQSADIRGFVEAKTSSASSVQARHMDAARAVNESLQAIFKEDEECDLLSENHEVLSKIDDDLDALKD